MDFTNYTYEELVVIADKLNTEIGRKRVARRKEAEEELIKLLDQVNTLQEEWDFCISGYDDSECERIYNLRDFNVSD